MNSVGAKDKSDSNYSLLAELALRLAKSPEDVATEGLVYVLSRSEAAGAPIQRLAADWVSMPLRTIVSFRSQVGAGDGSRPDVEAHDVDGIPVLIFESKFWAGLTPAQPVAYLQRLAERGGVLCFVAPTSRVEHLWVEVTGRARYIFPMATVVQESLELKVASVRDGLGLVVTSWAFLLGQLRTALEAHGESALVADVRQLLGLAARMDTTGFLPLTASDITGPTARHVLQFCDIVNGSVESLLRRPVASKRGLKARGGEGWWGHYIWLHRLGCQLSFNAPMWARHGRSPIWLSVASPTYRYSAEVERAMIAHLGRDACILPRERPWPGVYTALSLPLGREREEVIAAVVEQVLAIATSLQGIAPPETALAAPEIEEG